MPCSKCNSDFNFLNWKIKCGECENKFCFKCLKKQEGVLYCDKCIILLERPPDRAKLMGLKPKDLQNYLKRHNISTHGLVEKPELVDYFCNKYITIKQKSGTEKLTANLGCSLPNFRENFSSEFFGTLSNQSSGSDNGRIKRSSKNQSPIPPDARKPSPRRISPENSPRIPTDDNAIPSRSGDTQQYSPLVESDPPSTSSRNTLVTDPISLNSSADEGILKENPVISKCPKLRELKSEENISHLSTKQLKILLALNRVDYKGCVEKKELLDKVVLLWNDSRKKDGNISEEDDMCKLCMDASLDCVFLECGHIATCLECGKKLAECPICRQYISRVVRIFKA